MSKTYAVDIIGVSRFLYSDDSVKFLRDLSLLPLLEDEVHLFGGIAFRDHRRLHRR